MREQNLIECGLSQAQQALAVGKLLGVEVFAALETYPEAQGEFGLVVFDANSGVKLWDMALSGRGNDALVQSISSAVEAAVTKHKLDWSKLRTVGLLSVRNADLPHSLDNLCDAMGRIVEQELVNASDLAVMERGQLGFVNVERGLATDSGLGQLAAAKRLGGIGVFPRHNGPGWRRRWPY